LPVRELSDFSGWVDMEAGKQTGGDMFANSKEGPKGCLDELSLWEVDAEDEDL